jgi:hypothetical protein
VGHKWLYAKLKANDSNVKWAGCVEMRAEPYDLNDTAPDTGTPDTLFVPFFWPDEPDSNNDNGDTYHNNYLNDQGTFTTGSGWREREDPAGAQKSLAKYNNISWRSGQKDTSFPYESGPNYGCPRPIVPLTNSKSTIETAIDNMIAYGAMGTFIPTGLVWGWHVLSPGIPFTEGVGPGNQYYDRTVKALVLLSDGENSVTAADNHNKSRFSAYNYTGLQVNSNYRLGASDADTAQTDLNTKTSTLCTNVKNGGIRLYTITFGDIPNSAKTLMENCASVDKGAALYYHAPSNSELEDIFHKIGEDLSEIHLSM